MNEQDHIKANAALPRLFRLVRRDDVSGVSGVGHVADGVNFWNDVTVVCWRHKPSSTIVFQRLQDLLDIHGHGGKTWIEWVE